MALTQLGPDNSGRPVSSPETRLDTRRRVTVAPTENAGPSLGVDDIYYILFRNKWKIIICSLLGFGAAAGIYLFWNTPYQSEAKLFVRYVVMEGKAVRPATDDIITKSPDMRGETIMLSEQEILSSLDLARNVAQALGPEKILGGNATASDVEAAAVTIRGGLSVNVPKYSSVVSIQLQHSDAEMTRTILREMITQYLKMHVEIHRAAGMMGDYLAQETDQLRSRLVQTEEELRKAKAKAGVISLEEAKRSYAVQIDSLRQQIFAARADQAQRAAILKEILARRSETPKAVAPAESKPVDQTPLPPATVGEYRNLLGQVESLRRREQDLLVTFQPENPRVLEIQAKIEDLQKRQKTIEEQFPQLLQSPRTNQPATSAFPVAAADRGESLDFEAAQLNALEVRIKTLMSQMDTLRADLTNLDQLEGTIQELMRRRELEDANYRRYAASLEQSRINEAMGSGKISNISVIQTPSPPAKDTKKLQKIVAGVGAGGLFLGLGWAFLIEMVLDRSIRRPRDVEKTLKLPLFLAIPLQRAPRKWLQRRKRHKAVESDSNFLVVSTETADSKTTSALNLYHETLRDRLIGYFESRNLTHKPKLVAVTGLTQNSGVTTMAAGLARCLSETGDGNVLLVDLTPGQGSAQHFHAGKAGCGLEQLLETRADAQVQDRLFVVSDGTRGDKLSRLLPQRFSKLLPQLKSSDFDYIIFDMPPVSQISITPRLAGFMDMVLLVIESEKNGRDGVQRAAELLIDSKAHVGAVLNKTRQYIPGWLHQELAV